ncbi:MAG: O-methyltransferase [Bacteroidales bacterium]|jgi:predicted O-methyltransferase YrrM|nr:O-methyltransferase [Bacteroidales bacterium]
MEKQIYPFIDKKITDYCEKIASKESEDLQFIDRQTHLRCVKPQMVSGNWQGTFFKILSHILKPHNVLEVGTFTGYATLCLAAGLAKNGIIHTIEADEEKEDFLRNMFGNNSLNNRIVLHIGNALDIIPEIEGDFDLIFIDADKISYPEYYELCRKKLRKGGVLLADNVLWYGKVALTTQPADKQTQAIKRFNELVQADETFENVIIPIRDGLMLAVKL